MRYIIVSLFVIATVTLVSSYDLIVGTSFNNRLAHSEKIEYTAIPLKKRVKEYFWSDPAGVNKIKGIIVRDLDHTRANATVTAGGVEFSYVNLKLKSERGGGINFSVEIYI